MFCGGFEIDAKKQKIPKIQNIVLASWNQDYGHSKVSCIPVELRRWVQLRQQPSAVQTHEQGLGMERRPGWPRLFPGEYQGESLPIRTRREEEQETERRLNFTVHVLDMNPTNFILSDIITQWCNESAPSIYRFDDRS